MVNLSPDNPLGNPGTLASRVSANWDKWLLHTIPWPLSISIYIASTSPTVKTARARYLALAVFIILCLYLQNDFIQDKFVDPSIIFRIDVICLISCYIGWCFGRRFVIEQLITRYVTMAQLTQGMFVFNNCSHFFGFWVMVFTCSGPGFVLAHYCPAARRLSSSSHWVHQEHWNMFTWEDTGSFAEWRLRFWENSF